MQRDSWRVRWDVYTKQQTDYTTNEVIAFPQFVRSFMLRAHAEAFGERELGRYRYHVVKAQERVKYKGF